MHEVFTPLPLYKIPTALLKEADTLVSDIDGTITDENGELALTALAYLPRLAACGVKVVLSTGRSAGWASAFAHYLPGIFAVLAENGAVLIHNNQLVLLDSWDADEMGLRTEAVLAASRDLQVRFPHTQPSLDNFSRLTDLAFSTDGDVADVAEIARAHNISFTYSSVHHHLSVSSLNKATGLEVAFAQHLHLPTNNIITIGDSFNDGPLFDRTRFLTTVGVRAVLDHLPLLGANAPVYVSDGDASEGFSELAARLCAAQSG